MTAGVFSSATAAQPESGYAWLRLAASLLLGTIGGVGMWSVVVIIPAVQAEFGGGRGEASLAYTLTMLGGAAGGILMGRVADRLGAMVVALIAAMRKLPPPTAALRIGARSCPDRLGRELAREDEKASTGITVSQSTLMRRTSTRGAFSRNRLVKNVRESTCFWIMPIFSITAWVSSHPRCV